MNIISKIFKRKYDPPKRLKCQICEREKERNLIDLHHIDGNRFNNARSNLILMCKECHIKITLMNKQYNQKSIIADSRGMRERKYINKDMVADADLDEDKSSAEIKINVDMRPLWEAFVYEQLSIQKVMLARELINSGARYLREITGHGSSVTTNRYLKEDCSDQGYLISERSPSGKVIIRLKDEPFDEKER